MCNRMLYFLNKKLLIIMAKIFTTNFLDDDNNPATGLNPIISILDVETSTIAKTDFMTEIGVGLYKYVFDEYDSSKYYAIRCDANTDIVNRYNYGASEVSINIEQVVKDSVWEANLDDYKEKFQAGYKLNTVLHPKAKFST